MFRSEATDTLMGSGSASWNEDRTLCDGVSINITVTPLVRSESEQNSSHLQIDCDRGRWRSLQGLKAITDIPRDHSP